MIAPNNRYMAELMRQNSNQKQRHSSQGAGMGEYIQDLPYRTLITKGPGYAEGPVSAPTILAEPEYADTDDILREILREIRRLPWNQSLEFRTRFGIQPREALAFTVPGEVLITAATEGVVASLTVQQSYTGFLEKVGVNVIPGAFSDIEWFLRMQGGGIHPGLSNLFFTQSHMTEWIPFRYELLQGRTVELVARNSAAVDITVQGMLNGWTEFMADFKPYGSNPQTGIA